jgi:hypothetical protein
VPEIVDGEALVRVDWMSLDPAKRAWIGAAPSYSHRSASATSCAALLQTVDVAPGPLRPAHGAPEGHSTWSSTERTSANSSSRCPAERGGRPLILAVAQSSRTE